MKMFRELMRYPDGGQSALDWLHPKDERLREDATTPIVVFLPGITGTVVSILWEW